MRNQNGLEIKNSHREHTLESSLDDNYANCVRTLLLKKTSLVSNVCYDIQLTKPTPTAQIWLLDEVSLLVLT